jgi:hypothetical protein
MTSLLWSKKFVSKRVAEAVAVCEPCHISQLVTAYPDSRFEIQVTCKLDRFFELWHNCHTAKCLMYISHPYRGPTLNRDHRSSPLHIQLSLHIGGILVLSGVLISTSMQTTTHNCGMAQYTRYSPN